MSCDEDGSVTRWIAELRGGQSFDSPHIGGRWAVT